MKLSNWKEQKINTRLLLFLFSIILLFTISGIIWNNGMRNSAEKIASDFSIKLIAQINNRLDIYFENLDREIVPLITSSLVNEFLMLSDDQLNGYQLFALNEKFNTDLTPAFLYSGTRVQNISIVSKEGAILSRETSFDTAGIIFEDIIKKADLLKHAYWVELHVNPYYNKPYIRFIRKIYSNGYQLKGFLVVDLQFQEIERLIDSPFNQHNQIIWIVDSRSGQVIYHPDSEKMRQQAPQMISNMMNSRQTRSITSGEAGTNMLVMDQSSITNWTILIEIPYDVLTEDVSSLIKFTFWIAVIMVGLLIWLGVSFSWSLTKSILQLKRMFGTAEIGKFNMVDYQYHRSSITEMNSLFEKFTTMVQRINELMKEVNNAAVKEKELQIHQSDIKLKLMNSQINPHFLYNSLEVINSYALLTDVQPISHMAKALASMFRYSVKGGQKVSLAEEIEHIQSYLLIQKERYQDTIRVEMRLEECDLRHVGAARITLQPLVENVFIHAYEGHELNPEYIGIIGYKHAKNYIIEIIDHGMGMPQETLIRLNRTLIEMNDDVVLQPEEMGIINVHMRINKMYGSRFGLHIVKSDLTGTIVRITLPIIQ